MLKLSAAVVSFVFAGFSVFAGAADKAEDYFVSKAYGIKIKVPVDKSSKAQNLETIATFQLPAVDSFSGTVSITRQEYTGPLKNYDDVSLSEFKKDKTKLLKHELKENMAVYEYIEKTGDRNIHYYIRVLKSANYIYIAVAVSLESRWEKEKNELVKSIDSFTLIQ